MMTAKKNPVPHWLAFARTLTSVLGPRRLALLGEAADVQSAKEALQAVAGAAAVVVSHADAQAGAVICDEQALPSILAKTGPLPEVFALIRHSPGSEGPPLRARVEQIFINAGYIKSPAMTALFDYAQLDADPNECQALFVHRPLRLAPGESAERMKVERDLHADMLREAGVRSDAHVVRYQLAATLIRPGDRVLDGACGLGYGSHILASLSPAAQITGIDLSEWGVEHAQRNYGDARVGFLCGSLPEALAPLPSDPYDFIVSLETLEHVPEPQMLLQAFWRILKPGGRIFVSVPNDWADETGKDPNPHHLHVYDWARLRSELEQAQFIVETAWSLTASGCKTAPDRRWRAQPRKLTPVELCDAAEIEGEWWLACAMKSPLAATEHPYEETVHSGFQGTTHLVDFELHYQNPWIVRSLVEIPWRMRDPEALRTLAQAVFDQSASDSADRGAALAILGYRLLEQASISQSWHSKAIHYRQATSTSNNPHAQRWGVSLAYLQARMLEQSGDDTAAIALYRFVMDANISSITPTLATKHADASLRAGMLEFRAGRIEQAKTIWKDGLNATFSSLQALPIEFIGNFESPFIFSMNDLVEITDGATRLSNALRIVGGRVHPESIPRQLGMLARQSLRSAVAMLQNDIQQLLRDVQTRDDFIAQQRAHDAYTQKCRKRLEEIEAELKMTQQARDKAELTLNEKLEEIAKIQASLGYRLLEYAHRFLFRRRP